jgi:ubiquinone/menaquinone biosynthesis C-methylase UbiE
MHRDWVTKLFVDRSDLFLKVLNERWVRTEELVNGMTRVLDDLGIRSGNLLDLCCGNGRVSVYMAKKGFKTVGVDISKAFLDDARIKAREHGVSDLVSFLEGDVRKLRQVVHGRCSKPFDVVVSAWTSVGFYSQHDDLSVFKQAQELSRKGAVLLVVETMHTEFLSLKFTPTSYSELDGIIMLEDRKYDPIASQVSTSWIFYNKRRQDLKFIDKVDIVHHVYSLGELCSLLVSAGWEIMASYGSLATLQPVSPLTHMNIIAKAV